jgi:hypothetical protein
MFFLWACLVFLPFVNRFLLISLSDDKSHQVENEGMLKSENNSTWSDDDTPPQLRPISPAAIHIEIKEQQNSIKKLKPLLTPLKYKESNPAV